MLVPLRGIFVPISKSGKGNILKTNSQRKLKGQYPFYLLDFVQFYTLTYKIFYFSTILQIAYNYHINSRYFNIIIIVIHYNKAIIDTEKVLLSRVAPWLAMSSCKSAYILSANLNI